MLLPLARADRRDAAVLKVAGNRRNGRGSGRPCKRYGRASASIPSVRLTFLSRSVARCRALRPSMGMPDASRSCRLKRSAGQAWGSRHPVRSMGSTIEKLAPCPCQRAAVHVPVVANPEAQGVASRSVAVVARPAIELSLS